MSAETSPVATSTCVVCGDPIKRLGAGWLHIPSAPNAAFDHEARDSAAEFESDKPPLADPETLAIRTLNAVIEDQVRRGVDRPTLHVSREAWDAIIKSPGSLRADPKYAGITEYRGCPVVVVDRERPGIWVEAMHHKSEAPTGAFSGAVNCSKCCRQHWIGAECPKPEPAWALKAILAAAEGFPKNCCFHVAQEDSPFFCQARESAHTDDTCHPFVSLATLLGSVAELASGETLKSLDIYREVFAAPDNGNPRPGNQPDYEMLYKATGQEVKDILAREEATTKRLESELQMALHGTRTKWLQDEVAQLRGDLASARANVQEFRESYDMVSTQLAAAKEQLAKGARLWDEFKRNHECSKSLAQHDIDGLRREKDLAESTLIRQGWTHQPGAEAWKPPIGPSPSPLFATIDQLRAELAEVTQQRDYYQSKSADYWQPLGEVRDSLGVHHFDDIRGKRKPAESYRLLETGEIIQEGDEFLGDFTGLWIPSTARGETVPGEKQYRRPITAGAGLHEASTCDQSSMNAVGDVTPVNREYERQSRGFPSNEPSDPEPTGILPRIEKFEECGLLLSEIPIAEARVVLSALATVFSA